MVERLARALVTCLSALCLAAGLLAVGCASHAPSHDAELAQIDEWLPGRYDNQEQIAADRRAGRPPHEPLALTVLPVDALQMGHHVFYVEESAGRIEPPGTPRLILAQHLASIEIINGKIIAAIYSFTDSQRWRAGLSNPELFSSLQPEDVKLMRGCGLTWSTDQPGKDVAANEPRKDVAVNDPSHCITSSALTGGAEPLAIRVELTREEIAVSTAPAEAGGSNPAADSYTRFRRSGGF
ncbi:MAG TPA: CpcT/CpeT family chromophore lyase [Steroidobacteraceae bacterium]|nr:CpcT/CpeT family chromophore lyase [Steroidobacteraceae bacterium]